MAYFFDDFDGVNGTQIDTHNAAYSVIDGVITDFNLLNGSLEYTDYGVGSLRYTGESNNDDSTAILEGGLFQLRVGPAVRCSASNSGYSANFEIGSDPTYTRLAIYKDGSRIAFNGSVSVDSSNDIELRITATDNGSDVDIEVWVDGVSELTYTDLLASTPLPQGNGGMYFGTTAGGVGRVKSFATGASGITLTTPDSATEGAVTAVTGTDLDTVTTFSLQTDDETHSIVQTDYSASDATNATFTADSGVSDAVPGTPANGIPLEPTITAAGITAYQIQMKADDGSTPVTRDITLNGEATHDTIQAMVTTSNTTVGESIFGTDIVTVEDNMLAYAPKSVNGMNITWAADGTFTTDADQTETIRVYFFSPANGTWGATDLTITQTTVSPTSGLLRFSDWIFAQSGLTETAINDRTVEYLEGQGFTTGSKMDKMRAWLESLAYTGGFNDMFQAWKDDNLDG